MGRHPASVAGQDRSISHVLAALAVIVLSVGALAAGYPKPAAVPYRWELTFEPGELRLYRDPETSRYFWWFTYAVTNRTNGVQLWAPSMVLYTDTGEIIQAGKEVPGNVTEALLGMMNNQFLEDQNEIIGDILQGKEHMKEGLVVWRANSLAVNEVSLFISGTSGETARVKNPISGSEVILRKTLQRDYLIPGDATARGSEPAQLMNQEWVMR
jgi:hypothetical protein